MGENGTPHSHDHEPDQQIFLADKIILLTDYQDPTDINQRLNSWLQSSIAGKLAELDVTLSYGEKGPAINTFDTGTQRLATVSADINLEHADNWADRLISIVKALSVEDGSLDADGIRLQSATPNWLFGAATHGFGDGGPGGEPVLVHDDDTDRYGFVNIVQERLINQGQCSGATEQEVTVVIFDTAPLETYATFQGNELLNSLRPKLTVHRASDTGIPVPSSPSSGHEDFWLKNKGYRMSDHGLFIAGTIHTWAPNATIHLVEVMSDYGVCSLDGVIEAFKWLQNTPLISKNNPLVINCSLCLCASYPLIHQAPHCGQFPFSPREIHFFELLTGLSPYKLMLPLQRSIDGVVKAFSENGVRIIAAAGNDSREGFASQEARYPAAFPCVVGVGATDKNGNRASYSNRADSPPYVGMMVFGGESRWDGTKYITLPGEGMLGIYLDVFPDGTPSANGWAWWSGTSFATGVMSGMFAYSASKGCDISCKDQAQLADDFVEKLKAVKDGETPLLEPVMDTPQRQVVSP